MPKKKEKPTHGLEIRQMKAPSGRTRPVPVGIDPSLVLVDGRTKWIYTQKLADQIIRLYREGNSVRKIAEHKGMPSMAAIYHWMEHRKDFASKMKEARALRGLYFEEKAIETAESTHGYSSEEVAAKRLQVETYKWAAETSDPSTYGKKAAVQVNAPAVIVIDTGFREEPKPEPKDIPAEIVEKKDG